MNGPFDGLTSGAGRTRAAHSESVGNVAPTGRVSNRDGSALVPGEATDDAPDAVVDGAASNVGAWRELPQAPATTDGGAGRRGEHRSSTAGGTGDHGRQRREPARRETLAATLGTT